MKIVNVDHFSEEHYSAVKVRKQVLGGTIDWEQEKKLTIFAAIEEGKVVGTAAVQCYPLGLARIRQVAVAPAYQGQHIGDQLMDHCEEFAQRAGHNRILLTGRQTAETFYRKRGYQPVLWPFKKQAITFIWLTKQVTRFDATLSAQS